MRVLALGPEPYEGFAGIAQGTRDFLNGLASANDVESIHLLARRAPDGGPSPPSAIISESSEGFAPRYAARAARLARTGGFDLVFCLHVNLMPVAAAIGRVFGLPVWLTIHGIEAWEPPRSSWKRRAISSATLVTSSSRYTRERFLEWARLPAERVAVNNNPVHLERWGPGPKPAALVERYGLGGKRVLMTLGRMLGGDRFKGHDEILDVLPELAETHEDVAWLVVGDGPDRARIEERVRTSAVSNRVVFTGRIADSEKRDHYLVSDAYALPSTTEGFGIAYLEAAACGLPVLGSSRDGSRDALADGRMGILVDPTDRASLLDGLRRLLESPKGVPGELNEFSFEHMSHRMRSLLESHIAPSRGVAA